MRAFIAIDLPEFLIEELKRRQTAFAALLGADAGVRWVRPGDIHLTLKFLGEVSDATAREIAGALNSVAPFSSFEVEVKGFGFFPDAKRPRVFWTAIKSGPQLAELARRIESVTGSFGFPAEDRPFSPHLTLARFRDSRPQPALQKLADESTSIGEFEISEFCLFESQLTHGAPPEYRKIARFPLHP